MFSSIAAAADSYRMVGLGMHQETSRNIYLGAMHLGANVAHPGDLAQATAPRKMEYRIIARRTSIRSLLGTMMLQAEVANGAAPGGAVLSFADDILSSVQGSLYEGDSFALIEGSNGVVTASLNGFELAATRSDVVFPYLLQSWIGERGPSTAFRNSILNIEIPASLLAAYNANTASEERVAAVMAWGTPDPVEVAVAASAAAVYSQPVADAAPAPKAQEIEPSPEIDLASLEEIVPQGEAVVALDLQPEATLTEKVQADLESMDVVEYSNRLAGFNTNLLRKVYSEIQYPRRAVRRDIQGALELDVTMQENGKLVKVAVAQSSGHNILDAAAVSAAEKALKDSIGDIDPVVIAEFGEGNEVVIPVPVNFILTQ